MSKEKAELWIETAPTDVADDLRRLGLSQAVDYQLSLAEDRGQLGDHRWEGITKTHMEEAIREYFFDVLKEVSVHVYDGDPFDEGEPWPEVFQGLLVYGSLNWEVTKRIYEKLCEKRGKFEGVTLWLKVLDGDGNTVGWRPFPVKDNL